MPVLQLIVTSILRGHEVTITKSYISKLTTLTNLDTAENIKILSTMFGVKIDQSHVQSEKRRKLLTIHSIKHLYILLINSFT